MVAQTVKNLPATQETRVQSLNWENPLEKGMQLKCFKGCAFILGVPTVPLLPPQVNQSLTSVPPMNPATTLPGKPQETYM